MFCNLLGEPLDNTNFTKRVWYPLLRHLGYEERKPYQMRHTAATLWLVSGEAPEWIARQLGHTSTEMLFRVYSRYVPNLTRQDGSAMERLLASRLSQGPLVPMDTEAGNFHSNSDAPTNQRGATALAVPTKVITYTPIHHAGTIQTMPQPKPRGRVAQRSCVRADPTTRAKTSVGCPKRVTQHERTR